MERYPVGLILLPVYVSRTDCIMVVEAGREGGNGIGNSGDSSASGPGRNGGAGGSINLNVGEEGKPYTTDDLIQFRT
jgi:hypothetical protein